MTLSSRISSIAVLLLASFASFGFTDCEDRRTPQGVVQVAYEALLYNNLAKFQLSVTGDALKTYGSTEGMKTLNAKFKGVKISTQEEKQVSGPTKLKGGDIINEYSAEIHGTDKNMQNPKTYRLMTLAITCKTHKRTIHNAGRGRGTAAMTKRTETNCDISQITLD